MKSSLKSIHEAGLGKRLIAMVMDGAIFAFFAVALALWVFTPIANATLHYQDLGTQALKYEVFSKLYVCQTQDADGNIKVVDTKDIPNTDTELTYTALLYIENDDVNFYKERIHYYYCCFKTGENLDVIEGEDVNDFRSPEYNIYIKDNNGNDVLPKDYYTEEWFADLIKDKTTVKEFVKLSEDATKDLRGSNYFEEINKKMGNSQLLIVLPSFYITYLGFYFLVPMLFKNGETFGKKVMKIGLATKDGYQVKKRQIVFRQLLLLTWLSLSIFIVGFGLTSIATFGAGIAIYLIATAIPKTKRSPIDFAAYTQMIETDKSVWFKDEKEEADKEAELEEKMSKYRHYEPDNKNLIQVGTEIVDEDVKRELEEENINKDNK